MYPVHIQHRLRSTAAAAESRGFLISPSRPAARRPPTHSVGRSLTRSQAIVDARRSAEGGRQQKRALSSEAQPSARQTGFNAACPPVATHTCFWARWHPSCTPGSSSFSSNSGEPHTWACSSQARVLVPWGWTRSLSSASLAPTLSLILTHSLSMSRWDPILLCRVVSSSLIGILPTALPGHVLHRSAKLVAVREAEVDQSTWSHS